MNEKEQKPKFKLFEKLKNVKHIEVYVAVIFIIVVLLIYFSTIKKSSTSATGNKKLSTTYEMTVAGYVEEMESNLASVLSNINGISDVKVMITLDMTQAQVQDSKINLSTFPDIKGIIITAKGVGETIRKMKVLHAVEAVLDVKNGNIEILSSD